VNAMDRELENQKQLLKRVKKDLEELNYKKFKEMNGE
jgi:hypothetical protein